MTPQDVITILQAYENVVFKRRENTVAIIPTGNCLTDMINFGLAAEPNQPTEQTITLSDGKPYTVAAVSLKDNIITVKEATLNV